VIATGYVTVILGAVVQGIFETMNDRGLSLSPTKMLTGYFFANIADRDRRQEASGRPCTGRLPRRSGTPRNSMH
jgi:hypothetical protein